MPKTPSSSVPKSATPKPPAPSHKPKTAPRRDGLAKIAKELAKQVI